MWGGVVWRGVASLNVPCKLPYRPKQFVDDSINKQAPHFRHHPVHNLVVILIGGF